jgi:hypothetical protein
MPRIPLGNFGNAIAEPAPRVSIPAGAFNQGEGVQQLARTGQEIATREIERQQAEARVEERRLKAERIETEAKQADTELTRRLSELQYDPQGGYFTKMGSAAVDDYEGTVKAARQVHQEISSSVADPEARRAFDLAAGQHLNRVTENISKHAMTQNRVVQVNTSESRAKAYIDSAASAYGDDTVFNQALATARNEAETQGRLLGLDAATVALRKKSYESVAWEKRFAAARMADPLFALALFQKNPEALDPDKRDNMGASLFAAAAPLMANEIAVRGIQTQAKNVEEAAAIAAAADQAGIPVRVATGTTHGTFAQSTFNNLPGDMKLRVINLAKQQLAQSQSLATHRLSGVLRDAESAALDGKRLALDPSVFSAFGPQADEMRARYDNSQVMADTIAQVRMMPVPERIAAIERATPKSAGAGYAEATARAQSVRQAVVQVNQMQTDDPVAFSMMTSPNVVKPAFDALQATMNDVTATMEARRDAARTFATATLAEQSRLGDTPQQAGILTRKKPILPNQMANAIAQQFVQQPEGGQPPARLIQMQAEIWGQHWPDVYAQIAKDIGPTARVIANIKDTPAAALLSLHAGTKTEEMKKALPAPDVKIIEDTIDERMIPARDSLVGWTSQGLRTFNDWNEGARRLALLYAGQGTKPADAAKRAVADVFDNHWEVRGTVRYPKMPGVDPRVAERGMARVLSEAGKLAIMVPPGEAATLGKDYVSKQLANAMRDFGFWITLGDDSGVALWMKGNNGPQLVQGANGQAITYTWKQLQDIATRPEAPGRAPAFGSTGGGAASGMTRGKP